MLESVFSPNLFSSYEIINLMVTLLIVEIEMINRHSPYSAKQAVLLHKHENGMAFRMRRRGTYALQRRNMA